MTLGELHQLSRVLRDITITAGSLPDQAASPSEVMVFEDIVKHSGTTANELSRRTGLAQSRVSTIVSDMVEYGAVKVKPDTHDARRKTLVVNQKLLRTLKHDTTDTSVQQAIHTLYPSLTKQDIRRVQEQLQGLFDTLR